ncbi:MAG: hypothetical protein U9R14_02805 [Patescibacteria group bacterium]|nr:hypothetical protein [Patescibacteria group bacterium]
MPQNSTNNNKQTVSDSPAPAKPQETAEVKKQATAEIPKVANTKAKENQRPIDQPKEILAKADNQTKAGSVKREKLSDTAGQSEQEIINSTVALDKAPVQEKIPAGQIVPTIESESEKIKEPISIPENQLGASGAQEAAEEKTEVPLSQSEHRDVREKPKLAPAPKSKPPVAITAESDKSALEKIKPQSVPILNPTTSAEIKKDLPVKTKPEQPTTAPPPPSHPVVPAKSFMVQFLNKLTELRKQANQKRSRQVEQNLNKIMEYAKKTQKVTNDNVEKLIGIGHRQAVNYLNILAKKGLLVKFGKTSNTFYKPVKK